MDTKKWRPVSESEFRKRLVETISSLKGVVKSATGPGRSGAICAVYASHFLSVPYLPYGRRMNIVNNLQPILLIDTAIYTGKTIRKAQRNIKGDSVVITLFAEPPLVKFFYESFCEYQE